MSTPVVKDVTPADNNYLVELIVEPLTSISVEYASGVIVDNVGISNEEGMITVIINKTMMNEGVVKFYQNINGVRSSDCSAAFLIDEVEE